MKEAARIIVEHPSLCLTCEEQILFGEKAWWVQGTGIWHEDCPAPRNLNLYLKESD